MGTFRTSTLEVSIVVTTPNIKSGTLLGGIIFTIKDEPAKSQPFPGKDKVNFEINTATAYVFGIQMNLPTAEIPRISFGNAGFLPKELAAYIELINDNYAILENVSGTYKVTNSSSVELFSGKFGPFSMAPKTKTEYPMKWNSQTLEPGDYILSISATANNEEISIQKSFTIQDKQVTEAQENNKLPQVNAKNGVPIWIWIPLIFVVAIIMYLLGRKKNKQ